MAKRQGRAAQSRSARHYLAGLLAHARASAVFTTPTINGYKRYRSYSLAPDRAIWGRDNRGVMIRVLGGAGRCRDAVGKPDRRARRQSLSLHGLADSLRPRRRRPQARSRPVGRYALRDQGGAAAEEPARGGVRAAATIRSSGRRWARSSSTITSTSRTPRSSAFRPRCRTGSTANISRCFEGRVPRHCEERSDEQSMPQQATDGLLRCARNDGGRTASTGTMASEACPPFPACAVIDGGHVACARSAHAAEFAQIPRYRCCRSGSAINCSLVPLHTVRPRSMM